MCWSPEVSLNTFIVGVFGFVFALANGANLPLMLFMMCFTTMQLAEYFIWKNIDVPYWNTVASWFGLTVLFLEVIFGISLMKSSWLKWSILGAYLLFSAVVWYFFVSKPYTVRANNGHLSWHWLKSQYYLWITAIWVLFFISPLFLSGSILLGTVAVATLLISIAFFYNTGAISSMWCWIANISWLFVIGYVALNVCINDVLCKKEVAINSKK